MVPAGARLMGQLVESDWLWRCWVSCLLRDACTCLHHLPSPCMAASTRLQEASPLTTCSLHAASPCARRHFESSSASSRVPLVAPNCCALANHRTCLAPRPACRGTAARAWRPPYAASPEPRALHLDPLHACPQAGPAQLADLQGSHPGQKDGPGHAALRALSAPFEMFKFDFAAPPPSGRSAQIQVKPAACSSGTHAVYTTAFGWLASASSMRDRQAVASALPASKPKPNIARRRKPQPRAPRTRW